MDGEVEWSGGVDGWIERDGKRLRRLLSHCRQTPQRRQADDDNLFYYKYKYYQTSESILSHTIAATGRNGTALAGHGHLGAAYATAQRPAVGVLEESGLWRRTRNAAKENMPATAAYASWRPVRPAKITRPLAHLLFPRRPILSTDPALLLAVGVVLLQMSPGGGHSQSPEFVKYQSLETFLTTDSVSWKQARRRAALAVATPFHILLLAEITPTSPDKSCQ
ncbi:hypothetical protein ABW21_db0200492 [Orbilia brochopaga]|nr:hypothetical protein ABW21_db0200492 [Drechslerella brochopaga]